MQQARAEISLESEALGSIISCGQVMALSADPSSSLTLRVKGEPSQTTKSKMALGDAVRGRQAQKHLSLSSGVASFWLHLISSCSQGRI